MIPGRLSGSFRYRFTLAVLPIEEIFHRRGGNQQDKFRICILCDDFPNDGGQFRARGGLVGQNEIARHITPPEDLWPKNRPNAASNTRLFCCVLPEERTRRTLAL